MVDLVVIIINYKTKQLTLKCLEAVFLKSWQHTVKVYLVDNGSFDGTVEAVKKKYPKVQVVESQTNLGFAGGNNLALKQAQAHWYLLLNSDTEVGNNSLDRLIDLAEQNNFDIASCKLVDQQGRFQANAGVLPTFIPTLIWLSGLDDTLGKIIPIRSYQERNPRYYNRSGVVGWVAGTAMLIKSEVISKIGLLDQKIFMYGEDVEFCWRAQQAGFTIGYIPEIEIVHLSGGSLLNPHYFQWLGEFRGLIYIYNKFYGLFGSIFLRLLIYFFILARMVAFFLIGKATISKTYGKILVNL